jgi:alkylation response protein AidB-like acyl-CoA dehydrogenase
MMREEEWVEKARLFCREKVVPDTGRFDREGHLPEGIFREMAREGFLGFTIPKEYGGSAVSTLTIAGVLEEFSVASLAVATGLAVHLSVASAPIARWGDDPVKERFLPKMAKGEWLGAFALTEPGAGSDAQHISSRYAEDSNGFCIDGTKTFITNGGLASVVLAFATKDPGKGSRGMSCFLVEKGTPGFSVSQRLTKLGLRASETTELLFENCHVPKGNLLGREGDGFKIAMTALEGGRVGIAACSLGVARAALDAMWENVRKDSPEWMKGVLAQSYVEVEAARALVERAAHLKDSGKDYGMAASAAKLFASQAAFRIASRAIDVVGTAGTRQGALVERLFRDSRVLTIVEGTTEIQELILGRSLVR